MATRNSAGGAGRGAYGPRCIWRPVIPLGVTGIQVCPAGAGRLGTSSAVPRAGVTPAGRPRASGAASHLGRSGNPREDSTQGAHPRVGGTGGGVAGVRSAGPLRRTQGSLWETWCSVSAEKTKPPAHTQSHSTPASKSGVPCRWGKLALLIFFCGLDNFLLGF